MPNPTFACVRTGGLGAYAYLINKYPNSLKAWVSTASILVTHLQTTAIVAQLRLAWPQSVETATSFLVVNGLNLQAACMCTCMAPADEHARTCLCTCKARRDERVHMPLHLCVAQPAGGPARVPR